MLMELCVVSAIAMNCLNDEGDTKQCPIKTNKANETVLDYEKKKRIKLLGGVSGTLPNGDRAYRTFWVTEHNQIILHYVPSKDICKATTVEEYENHRNLEKDINNNTLPRKPPSV